MLKEIDGTVSVTTPDENFLDIAIIGALGMLSPLIIGLGLWMSL